MNFEIAVNDKWQMPDWVYEKVDERLVALNYLPEEIYEELENLSEESRRNHISELLELHDSNLLKVEEKDGEIFLDINYSLASSLEGVHRLRFVEGKILENEINQLMIDESGFSNIYFIGSEVSHKEDYFEFHFFLDSYVDDEGESLYLTIKGKDLLNTSNPPE